MAGAEQPGAKAGEGVGHISSQIFLSKQRVRPGRRKRRGEVRSPRAIVGEGAGTNYSLNRLLKRRVCLGKGGGSLSRLLKWRVWPETGLILGEVQSSTAHPEKGAGGDCSLNSLSKQRVWMQEEGSSVDRGRSLLSSGGQYQTCGDVVAATGEL